VQLEEKFVFSSIKILSNLQNILVNS